MANETPQFFLNRDHKRLFAVFHESNRALRQSFAVVFCAALFEDKLWSHRVLVNFARRLAARGIAVLRFDYFGDGESEGDFRDASVSSRVADIGDAVDLCRRQSEADRVYVLGLCYGGTLALRAALRAETADGVVAWQPIMDGGRYASELLRAHLSAQMVQHRRIVNDREALVRQIMANQPVNVEGYEIGKGLYTEMIAVDVLEMLREPRKAVLVQQISLAERVEPQYAELAKVTAKPLEFSCVREVKFWTSQKKVFPPCDQLFAGTMEWLVKTART
jgi:exosortase A-associated hydrolase 2